MGLDVACPEPARRSRPDATRPRVWMDCRRPARRSRPAACAPACRFPATRAWTACAGQGMTSERSPLLVASALLDLSTARHGSVRGRTTAAVVRLKARFSAPTHMSREPARAGAVKVGRHSGSATSINVSRPHLDGSEHDGPLAVVGMTMSRGARFCSVEDLAPHACIRWTIEVRNHDAWMRIGERSLYEAVKVKRLFQGSLHFSFSTSSQFLCST